MVSATVKQPCAILCSMTFSFIACCVGDKCGSPAQSVLREYPRTCTQHDGLERCWFTHVPVGSQNAPLVVDMHGYSGCASDFIKRSGWKELADVNGFIVVWPQGSENLPGVWLKQPSWNGGTCCGAAQQKKIDDVGFIRKVVADTVGKFSVDSSRVYMAGHSNGCTMAQRMGVQASDIVAGVACHAMYLLTTPSKDYTPVPMMEIHGTKDFIVGYHNFANSGVGAMSNLETWKKINTCKGDPSETKGNGFTKLSYKTCARGADVTLVIVPGASHAVYKGRGTMVDTTQLAWNFLKAFPHSRSGDPPAEWPTPAAPTPASMTPELPTPAAPMPAPVPPELPTPGPPGLVPPTPKPSTLVPAVNGSTGGTNESFVSHARSSRTTLATLGNLVSFAFYLALVY